MDLAAAVVLLASSDAAERLQGIETISREQPAAAAPAAVELVKLAGDADDDVREAATAALEDLGPPAAESVDKLASLLASGEGDVAYWAATLLGRLGGGATAATPQLVHTAQKHPNEAAKERAVWALGQIGASDAATREALSAIAADGAHKRLARLAQQALGGNTGE